MDLSINVLITYIMHFFSIFYTYLEKFMGKSFDDLTTSEAETDPSLAP